ncbi:hypothetical protein [Lysobacter sp. M15]|uniref:hypothetical protein n=1 Tax=Lysobacter sp. M15 TaxID=2916837 RepID=UPI001F55B005|nr:hypothetical protein [Lysobacter sp. M15]
MKLLLATLVVGIAMNGFGVNAASMHTPEAETKAASAIDLTKRTHFSPLWQQGKQFAQTLPDCSTMHGQYCSTPGAKAYCWWTQPVPGERTLCRCLSNNTWSCAGL